MIFGRSPEGPLEAESKREEKKTDGEPGMHSGILENPSGQFPLLFTSQFSVPGWLPHLCTLSLLLSLTRQLLLRQVA